MPFPNFHSLRMQEPNQFSKFAYKKNEFGEGVDVVYGIKDGKTEVQAIRFNKDKFTPSQAKSWAKSHDKTGISFHPASNKKEKLENEDAIGAALAPPTPPSPTGTNMANLGPDAIYKKPIGQGKVMKRNEPETVTIGDEKPIEDEEKVIDKLNKKIKNEEYNNAGILDKLKIKTHGKK